MLPHATPSTRLARRLVSPVHGLSPANVAVPIAVDGPASYATALTVRHRAGDGGAGLARMGQLTVAWGWAAQANMSSILTQTCVC